MPRKFKVYFWRCILKMGVDSSLSASRCLVSARKEVTSHIGLGCVIVLGWTGCVDPQYGPMGVRKWTELMV